jgi:hypothetical protein
MIQAIHVLLRVTSVLCVLFCCTARPAMAQMQFQTVILNGLSVEVISPIGPVPVGANIYMSVAPSPHPQGSAPLQPFTVVLDARPLGYREGIELWDGLVDGISTIVSGRARRRFSRRPATSCCASRSPKRAAAAA